MPITAGGTGTKLPRGVRAKYADFLADAAVQVGTSIVRRPDAISFDYLIAHTVGPIAVGDTSDGIVSWVWQARATPTGVYITRSNTTRDGWNAETLLFGYGGAPIAEVDFAFDQNGQPIIVAEIGAALWIYYNDITLGGYGFRSFGAGRTPRVVLDDPNDTVGSDVLVFYVDPALGIQYRQQRDRYITAYVTTPEGAAPHNVVLVPQMNYGPVRFRMRGAIGAFVYGPANGPIAEIGDMTVPLTVGAVAPLDRNDFESLTDRISGHTEGSGAGAAAYPGNTITFSQMILGFTCDVSEWQFPNFFATYGAGTASFFRDGVQIGAAKASLPTTEQPLGKIAFYFPAGFNRVDLSVPFDARAVFSNSNILLTPAQLTSVRNKVCPHGPVPFAYTADPNVGSAVVDGVTIELRSPLEQRDGVPVSYVGAFINFIYHTTTPGIFRPMAWPAPERLYSWHQDADGTRFQSAPIGVEYGTSQLISGDNRDTESLDSVITFSEDVTGVEIVGIGINTLGGNFLTAFNSLGVQVARIEIIPPVYGARYTAPYGIFAPNIRSIRLSPGAGTTYKNGMSWGRLKFRKTTDVSVAVTGGTVPDPGSLIPPAPPVPRTDVYLEDAVRTPDGRVSILYSVRNAALGTYSLGRIDTVLYPYKAPYNGEGMIANMQALPGAFLFQLVNDYLAAYVSEGMTQGYVFAPDGVASLLKAVATTVSFTQPYVDEAMTAQVIIAPVDQILFLVIRDLAQPYDLEALTQQVVALSGMSVVMVYDLVEPYDTEGMTQQFVLLPSGNSLVLP